MSDLPVSSHSTSEIINDTRIVPSGINMTIRPDTGVYWKSHKILPCTIFLILRGNLTITVEVTGPADRVDFYINGVLQSTWYFPPYVFTIEWEKPFTKICSTLTAYASSGETVSKNITIWRLFR
jgi:hypothetical protein